MPVFKELIQDIDIAINTDLVVSNSKANQTDPTGFGSGSLHFYLKWRVYRNGECPFYGQDSFEINLRSEACHVN